MLYKNVKVLDVEPIIYLGDKAKDRKYNQQYVKKELGKVTHKFEGSWGIESPIDDMVLIYLPYQNNCDKETNEVKVDVDYLINSYEILKEIFEDVKINFYLDDYVDEGNSFDMSIEEFKQYNQIQKINQMHDDGCSVEEIAEILGEDNCVQSFTKCPEWCHEDADCNDCWVKCLTLELEK